MNINKSEFYIKEVKYLGLIIIINSIKMDFIKVEMILKWPQPQTVKNVLTFLKFVNFYKRFIAGFFKLAYSLMNLIKKETLF